MSPLPDHTEHNLIQWGYMHIDSSCRNIRHRHSFRSTWVHPRFLLGFVLLILLFSVKCFVHRCLFFFFWPCIVCLSSNYGFLLILWWLQSFLYIKLEWSKIPCTWISDMLWDVYSIIFTFTLKFSSQLAHNIHFSCVAQCIKQTLF